MDIVTRIYGVVAVFFLWSAVREMDKAALAEDVFAEPVVEIAEPERISIIFGGDVMQHMPQVEAARRDTTFDYSGCFRYLEPFFDSADLVVLNLETTITETGRYSGYPQFASPPHLVHALKKCGVDVLVLANNHTADKGGYGIRTTVRTVENAGIEYTGAFPDSLAYSARNPLVTEIKGRPFAFLNYTYDLNGMPMPRGTIVNLIDTVQMSKDIELARRRADYTIVCIHWGIEYARRPDRAQKELARWMHERGVDFVIGSHPHVIQPVEAISDSTGRVTGATAYSLGNLVSNQRKRYTDGGMFVRLNLTFEDSLPVRIKPEYMLAWVDISPVEGRKQYRILPSPVADTMALTPEARKAYELFIDDSRRLLGDGRGFTEICTPAPSSHGTGGNQGVSAE